MQEEPDLFRRSKGREILVALLDGPKHIRELQEIVRGSATTIDVRVKELIQKKYVRQREQKNWPFRRTLQLTEMGQEAARLFRTLPGIFVTASGPPRATKRVDPTERQRFLLATIQEFGGRISGSTRLQKLIFLLTKHADSSKIPYEFNPYNFGPFSPELLEDVEELETNGLVQIELEVLEPRDYDGDFMVRKNYKLTKKGLKLAHRSREILNKDLRRNIENLNEFVECKLSILLAHVYKEYPEESKGEFERGD